LSTLNSSVKAWPYIVLTRQAGLSPLREIPFELLGGSRNLPSGGEEERASPEMVVGLDHISNARILTSTQEGNTRRSKVSMLDLSMANR
jgi:hypothetical protein